MRETREREKKHAKNEQAKWNKSNFKPWGYFALNI